MEKHLKERGIYENPYKKYEVYGAEGLSDAELLAIFLRTGSRKMDALALSRQILTGCQDNLLNLSALSADELMGLPGIGRIKTMELRCLFEISRRISKESRKDRLIFSNSHSIALYFMEEMRHLCEETLLLACFDAKGRLSSEKMLTKGGIDSTTMDSRLIIKTALLYDARFIVILHNHPSGDPSPSTVDRDATYELKECCDIMGIPLVDHIIIGDRLYYSFKENKEI